MPFVSHPKAAPFHRRAMTLIEMTITVFMISLILFLLTGWMTLTRQASRESMAVRELSDLDNALARYKRATGSYPSATGANAAILACQDLLEHPRSRDILGAFPKVLWQGLEADRVLLDPWGTPLRYLPFETSSAIVIANNGRPIFLSAGPDQDFGDENVAAIGDNLRSDDPGPDGFRLQEAIREALDAGEPGASTQPTSRPAQP